MWEGELRALSPTHRGLGLCRIFPAWGAQGREVGWWCSAQRGLVFRFTPSVRQDGEVQQTRGEREGEKDLAGRSWGVCWRVDRSGGRVVETKDQQEQIYKQRARSSDAQKQPQGCFWFRSVECPQSSQPSNFRNFRGQRGWKRVLRKKPLLACWWETSLWVFHRKGHHTVWTLLQESPGIADPSCLWWLERLAGPIHKKLKKKVIRSLGPVRTKFWWLSKEKKTLN